MIKKINYSLLVVLVVLLAASCSSSKQASKAPMVGNLTGTEYLEKFLTSAPQWSSLSSKASFDLGLGGKGNMHVSGTFRIRRGEVVQFSIAPVLGIEVARMELTPKGMLLVDRINKRYVRASFKEVSELLHMDVNFHILQSLFLNEVFLSNKTELGRDDLSSFGLSMQGNQVAIQPKGMKRIHCQFLTSAEQGLLEHTLLTLQGTKYRLNWDYTDFTDLRGRLFPKKTNVSLHGMSKPYYLNLKLSRLSLDGKWDSYTELSARYEKIELKELLKVLLKL